MAGFEWARMAVLVPGLALAIAPASAQDARDLDGARSDIPTFTGSVEEEPGRFRLTMAAGTALVVDARPGPTSLLDPYVRVIDAKSGEVLGEDDDGAGNYGARTFVFTQAERQVEIVVNAEGAAEAERSRGDFELSVRPTDWRPMPPRNVEFGSETKGTLQTGERHVFHIEVQDGQQLTATLRADESSPLDAFLELRRGTATAGEPLVEDDDGAGSLNARIRHVARGAGTYTLVARSLGTTQGAYTLEIGDGAQAPGGGPEQEIGLDESVLSELESFDGEPGRIVYRLSDNAKAALRSDPGTAVVRMNKTEEGEFDPLLELAFETPLGLAVIASDDDGGGELNAELTVDFAPLAADPTQLDRLRIIARSVASTGGQFRLEIDTQ